MAYCDRADVEDVYGVENVKQLADLDGDEDTTKIANRIARAIAVADARIDDVARVSGYGVSLKNGSAAVPTTIENLSAVLAGVWLYEARGCKDVEPRSGIALHQYTFRLNWANMILNEIRDKKILLDAVQ